MTPANLLREICVCRADANLQTHQNLQSVSRASKTLQLVLRAAFFKCSLHIPKAEIKNLKVQKIKCVLSDFQ